MGELPHSVDLDMREAKAMLDGFVPYIYEGELYGKLGMNMPRLTPGALLLRMTRLERLHNRMKDAQLRTYQALRNQFTSLTTEWQQAYRKKLAREAASRLRDLQTYLGECKDDARGCASNYLPEAVRRTILHEICSVLTPDELGELAAKVKGADRCGPTPVLALSSGMKRFRRPIPKIRTGGYPSARHSPAKREKLKAERVPASALQGACQRIAGRHPTTSLRSPVAWLPDQRLALRPGV